MRPIESMREWRSSRPPGEVWDALTDVASYEGWWLWLETLDGDRCGVGRVLTATIRAPIGYRVGYGVRFTEVDAPSRIAAAIEGDLGGWAEIDLCPDGAGTVVRFRSSLHPTGRLLRAAAVVAEAILVDGHDRILDRGVAQFETGSGVDLTRVDGANPAVRTANDVARAALIAGVLSGAPSTAHAVVTRGDPLAAVRAAGTLLGRSSIPRGLLAHVGISIAWTAVLASALPKRGAVAAGVVAGGLIALVDLGIVGRRLEAISALPTVPQVVDHLAFGALVGAALDRSRTKPAH